MASAEGVPESWRTAVASLQRPRRRLRVALPCCGIVGSARVFDSMGMRTEACNVYDLVPQYEAYLRHVLGDEVTLHLGEKDGNLLSVPLHALELPIDILLAGPPCPPLGWPWKPQGRGRRPGGGVRGCPAVGSTLG